VKVAGRVLGAGAGRSKKAAEQQAAQAAWLAISEETAAAHAEPAAAPGEPASARAGQPDDQAGPAGGQADRARSQAGRAVPPPANPQDPAQG
jgi:ribonuclease III